MPAPFNVSLTMTGRGTHNLTAVVGPPAWQGLAEDTAARFVSIGAQVDPTELQKSMLCAPAGVAVSSLAALRQVTILIRGARAAGSPAITARPFVYQPGGGLGLGTVLALPIGSVGTTSSTFVTNTSMGRSWYGADLASLQLGVQLETPGGGAGADLGWVYYLSASAVVTRKVGKLQLGDGGRVVIRTAAKLELEEVPA